MRSLLDPRGLLRLPGEVVRASIKFASWCERQIIDHLRSRMEATAEPLAPPAPAPRISTDLDIKLAALLDRAIGQPSATSRDELFHRILDQIVPDEARIMAALSEGSASPMLNVYTRSRAGLVGELVLGNTSLVGRTANLTLPQLTPIYVGHLLSLGLVETGPEDPSLKDEYEILAADTDVLRALKIASRGPIPAPVEKRTLRLTEFGLALWTAARESRRRT